MARKTVRDRIIEESAILRDLQDEIERQKERLHSLFIEARQSDPPIGPAELERLTDRLYVKEHISKITTGYYKKDK